MIDTNIWIDLLDDGPFYRPSLHSVIEAGEVEQVIMSAVVWAELSATLDTEADIERAYSIVSYRREDFSFSAANRAGQAHRAYRRRGGRRERTLPDFLIGAHAHTGGHRLLTRDPVRYRTYFPDLAIVTPEGTP
nr:type II toxin-antitoxin system VapC family toxin [Fulvimarina sp. 2208YS6-2-32]